jgi:hypothetical protein
MRRILTAFLVLVVLALGAATWIVVRVRAPNADAAAAPGAARRGDWERLTPEGAARAQTAVESLAKAGSPASVTVRPGDLAAYVLAELAKDLPPSARDIEANIIGDLFYVRATVRPADMDAGALGTFAALLGDREQLTFGGTLDVVRSGLAQLRVTEIRVGDFKMPKALIPRLLRTMAQQARPAGVAEDAVGLAVPSYVSQVRLSPTGVIVSRPAR